MSSPDVNQDLQTYFDTFKCDMEESDDCVTLTAEALRALSEADAVTEKILEEDAGTNSDDHQSTDLLKNVQGRKGIYYLKLSNKESIQVKLIEESSPPKSNEDISTEKETDDNACLEDTDEKKEKIYEFDENDPEVKRTDNFPRDRQIEKLASGSVMHMVPRTNSSNVIASTQIHQCPKCFYTTNKRFLLSRHLHTHSDDRPYKCAVCDRAFKLSTALANHMNSHLNKKPHGCTYCEKRFNTSGELVRHIRYMHTGEKPHKCGECDYSSVELSKLRRHMRCHTGERPYQCPHCTYASPDTFKLKRHLRTHTGEKPYECDICLARFTQSNSLKAHRLIHSAGDRPSFQCSYCPTTCGRKTDLQLHMQKLHNPDRPVTCKRCRKELPDRYSYKVHVKTHEGEKCFRCTVCPHASISQRLLDMHMLIHTDEKPFCCEECGAAFRQRQLLVRHINFYHNDNYEPPIPSEKTHVCPHCNRAFSRKGNLMRHMETHDSQVDKEEEKIKLRIGRQIRIQPDGSICVPTNILECVISNDKTTRVVEDNETQVDDGYAILEIDDSDNVDSGGDGAVVLNSIKTDPNKLIEQRKYVVKQRNVIKQEQVKVKSHPSTDDANTDDDNEHIMVIEVIENDTENEGAITIENTKINESIIELPIQSGPKRNTANSHGFSNLGDYILPENYKNSQIQTIMDVINVD